MSKGKGGRGFGMPRPGGGGGGAGGMMQQIQRLQEEMAKTQEALEQETLQVTAGGGVVTVVITGQQKIQSITINPEIIDPEDVEMLQDLIVAAFKEAQNKTQELASQMLGPLAGGMDIGGLL